MSSIGLPLSGDVMMPWNWWIKGMEQIGFINIRQMASSDPEMEAKITREVAGYGQQLGRIIEALQAVIKTSGAADINQEDIEDFLEMAQAIDDQKDRDRKSLERQLDRVLDRIVSCSDAKRRKAMLDTIRSTVANAIVDTERQVGNGAARPTATVTRQ